MGIFNRTYPVTEVLSSAQKVLTGLIGDSLLSLIHFGHFLERSPMPNQGDKIQLLIVMKEINAASLDQLSEKCRAINGFQRQVAPMVMTLAEIESSTDVFPTTFLEIREQHEVLLGIDVFHEVPIDAAYLRLRCEQELKNLLLRLQANYLTLHAHPRQLKQLFHRSIQSFLQTLHAVQILFDKPYLQSHEELIKHSSEQLGLDPQQLETLVSADSDSDPCLDLIQSYCVSLIEIVAAAAAGVDQIPDEVKLLEMIDE